MNEWIKITDDNEKMPENGEWVLVIEDGMYTSCRNVEIATFQIIQAGDETLYEFYINGKTARVSHWCNWPDIGTIK